MSKAILVIDMPESCRDCNIMFTDIYSDYCPCNGQDVFDCVDNDTKPSACPLRELPERKGLLKQLPMYDTDTHYEQGYNACIDDILKGSEELD